MYTKGVIVHITHPAVPGRLNDVLLYTCVCVVSTEAHVSDVASDVLLVFAMYTLCDAGVVKLAAFVLLNSIEVIVAPAGIPAAAISAWLNKILLLVCVVVDVAVNLYTGEYKVFGGISVPVPICTVCAETFWNADKAQTNANKKRFMILVLFLY